MVFHNRLDRRLREKGKSWSPCGVKKPPCLTQKKINIAFYVLRLKPPSCRSAEDQEIRATLTTTKRRTFVSRKQKSVQKSLLSSSEWARVPSGLKCFGIFALSWGLRWNWGRHMFKTNVSFLHSTRLNEVLLAMILRAVSTNLYTGTLCRHPLCCNTEILDHFLIFCLLSFVFYVCHSRESSLLLISIQVIIWKTTWKLILIQFSSFKWHKEWLIVFSWYCTFCDISFGRIEGIFCLSFGSNFF